jgi:hypothetical protein
MDLQLAKDITTQYINLYGSAKLEEEKMQQFRDFFTQVLALVQASMPPAPPAMPGAAPGGGAPAIPPQAQPMPLPQSPLVPNINQG